MYTAEIISDQQEISHFSFLLSTRDSCTLYCIQVSAKWTNFQLNKFLQWIRVPRFLLTCKNLNFVMAGDNMSESCKSPSGSPSTSGQSPSDQKLSDTITKRPASQYEKQLTPDNLSDTCSESDTTSSSDSGNLSDCDTDVEIEIAECDSDSELKKFKRWVVLVICCRLIKSYFVLSSDIFIGATYCILYSL